MAYLRHKIQWLEMKYNKKKINQESTCGTYLLSRYWAILNKHLNTGVLTTEMSVAENQVHSSSSAIFKYKINF